MSKRVEYDPLTGITTTTDYNILTDELVISRDQDVSNILDFNKNLQNDEGYTKKGMKGEMWHYAQIPNVIIEKWLNEGFNIYDKNNEKALFRRLNSPEWKYLKTTEKIHF